MAPAVSAGRFGTLAAGFVILVGVCGCSGQSGGAPDASLFHFDGGDCFPVARTTPGGQVELGTGGTHWVPLPDSLRFRKEQFGMVLVLNARIKGLEPGVALGYGPTTPRTLVSATLADGTLVAPPCPATVGYAPGADGYDELSMPARLLFRPFSLGEGAFNTQVKLKVEVIDDHGHYASDEKTVLALPPEGTADAGVEDGGGPGSMDAGALDGGNRDAAGPADAGTGG